MQNLDEFRQAFDEKIKNLSEEKGLSTVLISRTTFNAIVKRLTEISTSSGEKKTYRIYRINLLIVIYLCYQLLHTV